ncbi:MAG TPA: hypothetical protein DGT21_11335 [Armatimonadetes bacterium]|jgi:hypothetical protein|nr:hypothetical protein [Armatimonadota bacterium]
MILAPGMPHCLRIIGLAAALLVCGGAQAACIVTGPPDAPDRICALALSASRVTALLPDGRTVELAPPTGLEPRAGCRLPDAGYLICGDTAAWVRPVQVAAQWRPVAGAPSQVRQAVGLGGNRLLLLYGGVATAGGLSGAQVGLYELTAGHTLAPLHIGVRSDANPRFLAVGELDDGPHALIGVVTVAVFDRYPRLRPWLYALAGERMTPAWLGTSFARPYITAGFGDVDATNAGDELCSLELDADGRRLITAYRRHGFVMEGVAQSGPGTLGDTLRTARIGPGEDLVCVWVGGATGQIVGYRMRSAGTGGLGALEPSLATPELARPAAWAVTVDGDGPHAVVLSAQGALERLQMRREAGVPVAIDSQSTL